MTIYIKAKRSKDLNTLVRAMKRLGIVFEEIDEDLSKENKTDDKTTET